MRLTVLVFPREKFLFVRILTGDRVSSRHFFFFHRYPHNILLLLSLSRASIHVCNYILDVVRDKIENWLKYRSYYYSSISSRKINPLLILSNLETFRWRKIERERKRERKREGEARRNKGLSLNETTKNYYRMIPRLFRGWRGGNKEGKKKVRERVQWRNGSPLSWGLGAHRNVIKIPRGVQDYAPLSIEVGTMGYNVNEENNYMRVHFLPPENRMRWLKEEAGCLRQLPSFNGRKSTK